MGDDRRARLQALAARAGRQREVVEASQTGEDGGRGETLPSTSHQVEGEPSTKRSISFRNYAPQDKSLEESATPSQEKDDDAESSSGGTSKKQRVAEEITTTRTPSSAKEGSTSSSGALHHALAKARQEMNTTGIDGTTATVSASTTTTAGATTLTATAPKKVNWDLKRDIADKLAKLERRTQKAIVEMLKERLEVQATEAANDDDDDDNLD